MTEIAGPRLSGRFLARNVFWNFFGMIAPALVAVVAIPYVIHGMGKERFGLLAIVWMLVGYFSLFDFGLGRALTKLVAERLGHETAKDFRSLIWTALWVIASFGVVGSLAVHFGARFLTVDVLNVPAALQGEAILATQVLALGIPFVVSTSALIGILEAHQRFASIAALRVPLGFLTFLGPVIALQFSPHLALTTAILVAGRVIAFVAYFRVASLNQPELREPTWINGRHLRPLLGFGGWLTVSNVIGPLMVYFDRFLVGSILTMTAVTYYVTPFEVLARLQMFPQAVAGVLFPALATMLVADPARLLATYEKATRVLVFVVVPMFGTLFLLAPEGLWIWLGTAFSHEAAPAARLLALGFMINAVARAPYAALQSAGRPDIMAKVHLCELLPYGALVWVLTGHFGIVGTAAAWLFRALVDAFVLNVALGHVMPRFKRESMNMCLRIVGIVAIFGGAWAFIDSLVLRSALVAALAAVSLVALMPMIRSVLRPA